MNGVLQSTQLQEASSPQPRAAGDGASPQGPSVGLQPCCRESQRLGGEPPLLGLVMLEAKSAQATSSRPASSPATQASSLAWDLGLAFS